MSEDVFFIFSSGAHHTQRQVDEKLSVACPRARARGKTNREVHHHRRAIGFQGCEKAISTIARCRQDNKRESAILLYYYYNIMALSHLFASHQNRKGRALLRSPCGRCHARCTNIRARTDQKQNITLVDKVAGKRRSGNEEKNIVAAVS